jgi:hypothetical protein
MATIKVFSDTGILTASIDATGLNFNTPTEKDAVTLLVFELKDAVTKADRLDKTERMKG